MTEHLPARVAQHSLRPTSLDDAAKIAKAMAESGMFGFKSPQQALSIMLLADAEGLHPAAAARDYHVIEGRPTLKADAMLGRFQAAGGKVEWHERNERIVRATFTHEAGGSLEVEWTIERANNVKSKNGKPITEKLVWKNYPAQMLTARCISEGVRTVFPGVIAGMYAPEEFDAIPGEVQQMPDPQPEQQLTPPEIEKPPVVAKTKSSTDHMIKRINSMADVASLDAYLERKASVIAQMQASHRNKIQSAIRAKRDALREAPPEGEMPEPELTGEGPFVEQPPAAADAEVVEGEVVTEGEETPPAEEAAPESAVERFSKAMEQKIKMAPTEEKLDGMWDAHAQKLARVKKGSKETWKKLYEMKRERAAVLREFEAEDA